MLRFSKPQSTELVDKLEELEAPSDLVNINKEKDVFHIKLVSPFLVCFLVKRAYLQGRGITNTCKSIIEGNTLLNLTSLMEKTNGVVRSSRADFLAKFYIVLKKALADSECILNMHRRLSLSAKSWVALFSEETN